MTYPSAMLKQEIARRMNGKCRVNLITGSAMSFSGERLGDYTSCADCLDPCTMVNATGLAGDTLPMRIERRIGSFKLLWPCPQCGHEVSEEVELLKVSATTKEIESDPCCNSCRTRKVA